MRNSDTVFAQLLKLVPKHDFNKRAKANHCGRELRRMTRWSQFVAMGLGHVARRVSLRDVVATLKAQGARLYHLGVKSVTRSSLSRVNEQQPYTLYEGKRAPVTAVLSG